MEENKSITPEYENKEKGRFSIKFPEEFGIPSEAVIYITKPRIRILLDKIYEDVEIRLLDYIKPAISKKLFEFVTKNNHEFAYSHHIMNKDGELVESWKVYVEKIKDIDFGENDCYREPTDNNIIYLTLRIANCELVV